MKNTLCKKQKWFWRERRGSVFILAYFVMVVLLGIGSSFLLMAANESQVSERQRMTTSAFQLAEAGVEATLFDLRQDFVNNTTGSPSWADGTINKTAFASSESDFSLFLSSTTFVEGGRYDVYLKNVSGTSGQEIWAKSVGTMSGAGHTLQVYARIVDVSPWGNAIFAGAGASGAMVNGNVDIRGSVHILGTGLSAGDLAIDIGGTAQLVGNNYSTMPSTLKAKVPALPQVNVNGEMVETLNAALRVKRGIVGISGNASVGEENKDKNAYKEQVDGVYVTDGFSGNKGAAGVYSDNGSSNSYDLNDTVSFPTLTTGYQGYSSYGAYLKANSLVLTTELSNIQTGAPFSYSDSKGSITVDASGNMTISGKVYVDENNDFILNRDVSYTGSGVIYVSGNVTINNNMVTAGNSSFPSNVLGIMTPNTITFSGAQNDVMGAFYAETKVVAEKQYDIVGTVVSNYFDFGTNVPAIYQVPELPNHLPDGMVGATSKWFMVVAWQKI